MLFVLQPLAGIASLTTGGPESPPLADTERRVKYVRHLRLHQHPSASLLMRTYIPSPPHSQSWTYLPGLQPRDASFQANIPNPSDPRHALLSPIFKLMAIINFHLKGERREGKPTAGDTSLQQVYRSLALSRLNQPPLQLRCHLRQRHSHVCLFRHSSVHTSSPPCPAYLSSYGRLWACSLSLLMQSRHC